MQCAPLATRWSGSPTAAMRIGRIRTPAIPAIPCRRAPTRPRRAAIAGSTRRPSWSAAAPSRATAPPAASPMEVGRSSVEGGDMMSIDRRFAWPTLRLALLPILGALAGTPAPAAADYYEGLTAYEGQDYALALSELEPLARTGDARAQLLLGRMYTAGQGTLQDFVRAHMWFNLAASAGAPEAAAAREAIAQRMTPDQIAA